MDQNFCRQYVTLQKNAGPMLLFSRFPKVHGTSSFDYQLVSRVGMSGEPRLTCKRRGPIIYKQANFPQCREQVPTTTMMAESMNT
jgi:hypothetical protein